MLNKPRIRVQKRNHMKSQGTPNSQKPLENKQTNKVGGPNFPISKLITKL